MSLDLLQAPLGALGIYAVIVIVKQFVGLFKNDKDSDNVILQKVIDEISKNNKSENKLINDLIKSNQNTVETLSNDIRNLVLSIQENNLVLVKMVAKEDYTTDMIKSGFIELKSSMFNMSEKWDKHLSNFYERQDRTAKADRLEQLADDMQSLRVNTASCLANKNEPISQEDINSIVEKLTESRR